MNWLRPSRRDCLTLVCSTALIFPCSNAIAQSATDPFSPPRDLSGAAPTLYTTNAEIIAEVNGNHDYLPRAARRTPKLSAKASGVTFGDWSLRPTLSVEQGMSDNIYNSGSGRISTSTSNLLASVAAFRDSGSNYSALFGAGGLSVNSANSSPDAHSARVGIFDLFQPRGDIRIIVEGEFEHLATGYSNGLNFTTNGLALSSAIGAASYRSPIQSNHFSTSASVMKSFERAFCGLGVSLRRSTYDTAYTNSGPIGQSQRDNWLTAANARVGYSVTPWIYLFANETYFWRSYNNDSSFDSNGYAALGGVGFDKRLYSVELFGGYQQQMFNDSSRRTASAPAVGVNFAWKPTRALSFSAYMNETLQDPGLSVGASPALQVSRVVSTGVNASYSFSERLAGAVGTSYNEISQLMSNTRSRIWSPTIRIDYAFDRGASIYFNYTHIGLLSATTSSEYERNAFLAGVKITK